MDRLQPRQELEAEQPAERERHRALAVGIDILAVDLHLGAVVDHALDHRRDLGRGRRFELGVDAQRFPLDVPVDHDAAAAVADMPLRRQVLVPGAEVLGIGRAGGCSVAPDRRVAGVQRAVGHDGDRPPQRLDAEIAPPHVGEVLVGHPGSEPRHALQAGVGSDPVQAKQQPRLQDRPIQRLIGGRAFQGLGEVQPQIGFLDHVEQAGHRPGRGDLGLQCGQVGRIGLCGRAASR